MSDRRRERLRIEVEGLHCEGCAETLREVLGEMPATELLRIDLDKSSVVAEFDAGDTTPERVSEALRQAGFPARKVERLGTAEAAAGEAPRRRAGSYVLFVLLVMILAVAGYAGYELYPRFDLPAAEGAALLLLAAGAGVASFFSPCAFGLLATLLAREAGARRAGRPLIFATGLSLGAAVFVLATGAVIAFGGAGLAAGVTFTSTAGRALRLSVGIFLILLGLVQLGLLPNPLHRVEDWVRPLQRLSAQERRRRPFWGYALFGFGYLLAGFG